MIKSEFSLRDADFETETETETEINLANESEIVTETEMEAASGTETENLDYTSLLESLILIETENQQILQSQNNALHGLANVLVFSLILFLGGWIAIKIFLQLF